MSRIKSAWEKALERTEGIEIDKDKYRHSEEVNKVRRDAGAFLSDDKSEEDLRKAISTVEDKSAVKEALELSLLNALTLSDDTEDGRLEKATVLASIVSSDNPEVMDLVSQLTGFLKQYPASRKELMERMKAQFQPMLEEKEEKLRKQYGQDVHLSLETDKDFLDVASKNLERLEAQYDATLQNAKAQLKEMIGKL